MNQSEEEQLFADAFPDYQPQSHLFAIHAMLRNLSTWYDDHGTRMVDAHKQSGDQYTEAMEHFSFAAGAYANAVIGAFAPLFEGVFNHEFRVMKLMSKRVTIDISHHRRKDLNHDDFWNPYVHVDKKGVKKPDTHIQHGTMQILKSLGIMNRFPNELDDLTAALFHFRNRSLHVGFEWLREQRDGFAKFLNEDRPSWKRWFNCFKESKRPWMFTVTNDFVEEGFAMAVKTVDAFERLRLTMLSKIPKADNQPLWLQLIVKDDPYSLPITLFQEMNLKFGLIRPVKESETHG